MLYAGDKVRLILMTPEGKAHYEMVGKFITQGEIEVAISGKPEYGYVHIPLSRVFLIEELIDQTTQSYLPRRIPKKEVYKHD